MSDLSEQLGIATCRRPNASVVIRLTGALDAAGEARLIDETAQIDLRSGDHVVVHLGDVTVVDDAGLGALCYIEAFVRARGGDCDITAPRAQIRAILEAGPLARCLRPGAGNRRNRHRSYPPAPPPPDDSATPPRVASSRHWDESTLIVTRTDTADGVWLKAVGEIDVASVPLLVDHLREAIVDRDDLVVVDLGDVTFLGAAGVNALIAARCSAPGRVRLGAFHPSVRRVLELTAQVDLFVVADEVPSA